jgi:protein-S-isoprenylcysteine O-methyltransferase Ste14
MQIVGKETIHPALFYSGKIMGYLTWVAFAASLSGLLDPRQSRVLVLEYISYAILAIGLAFSAISIVNLGRSTTLGLPTKRTELRKGGLYRLSRNPMYVGFDLLTLASMLYHQGIILAVMGVYSIVVYHLIILGEERFLADRFPDEYREYVVRVRRYLGWKRKA